MAGLRYAGQEGSLTFLDATTQDELIPSINVESISTTINLELVTKQFIGSTGPTFREFANGASFEFKVEHNDADESVAMLNAIKAKAEGKSADEFALQWRVASPDAGTIQISLLDCHFEDFDLSIAGRTDFLSSTIKGKCPRYKIEAL